MKAELIIHADQPGDKINRNIYGQFAEHLGRGIYEGIWVGEGSPIPNTRGIRNDVVAALKQLNIPVLRWPGGCFADEYHWRDGIGPTEDRPRRMNTHWGWVPESNEFGTHEFMDLCEQLGCDPYICGNLGSGSPEEMRDWVEYITSAAHTTLADLRRENGRDKPWKLPYFAIGNESWGCGGNMRPEFYADLYRRYNTFVKVDPDIRIERIACGPGGDDTKWTEVLMSMVGRQMNGLSLHYYTLPTGRWIKKGAATGFTEQEWHDTLRQTLNMEGIIARHSAIMDRYDPHKEISLIVDEWGDWYDVDPGQNPGFLFQQNTLRDAVVAALNFDLFHRHCDRVRMANIAQMVNVLQAMVLTDKEKMIVTPTYHVFEMYKVHQNATFLPVDITAPPYKLGPDSVPGVDASASRDNDGRIHLSLVNLSPQSDASVAVKLAGATVKAATGRVLTASAMDAHNTFDDPNAVMPKAFTSFELKDSNLTVTLPSKSVIVLEIQ
ncbi:MAG TPA: alpha-N-arabinofuranosidase [Verrucomicrobiae bacterium]|nr:alpha-N-arabinofuranosidase [Verrucomicrobiae bacterium]